MPKPKVKIPSLELQQQQIQPLERPLVKRGDVAKVGAITVTRVPRRDVEEVGHVPPKYPPGHVPRVIPPELLRPLGEAVVDEVPVHGPARRARGVCGAREVVPFAGCRDASRRTTQPFEPLVVGPVVILNRTPAAAVGGPPGDEGAISTSPLVVSVADGSPEVLRQRGSPDRRPSLPRGPGQAKPARNVTAARKSSSSLFGP